jgi:predicted 2-oxoglutarate/Fe(II)-dependent dioxygenase YbiX
MVDDRRAGSVNRYFVAQCFSARARDRIRAAMNRGAAEPAEILGADVTLDRGVRFASSIAVDRETLDLVENILDAQREAVAAFFGIALTAREGAGFVRYGAGGFYRSHRDRGSLEAWPAAARRRVSIVVFLNDSFDGGVLRLLDPPAQDVVPRPGCLVAFPSDALHEVTPVSAGTRDVIVDWFY